MTIMQCRGGGEPPSSLNASLRGEAEAIHTPTRHTEPISRHAERSEASNLDSATNNIDVSHSLNMTDKVESSKGIDVSLNAQHDKNKDSKEATPIIILDFFAGSGTTGQAVMELNEEDGGNRQCILVTNNENNIGSEICYERLYRVVHGKGSKGEAIKWEYSKDKKSLDSNKWDIFKIKEYELKINDFDKAQKLLQKAKEEFSQLNPNYEYKEFDLYNQLASLNPYKKEAQKDDNLTAKKAKK